jgi:hypothetical protein
MRAQPDLFPVPRAARAKPRVLMHMIDAGYIDAIGDALVMRCDRCGHTTEWMPEEPGDKRGRACPICNRREHA